MQRGQRAFMGVHCATGAEVPAPRAAGAGVPYDPGKAMPDLPKTDSNQGDSNQGDSNPGLAQPDLTGRVEVKDLGLSSRAWTRRRVDPGAPLRVKDPRRALEALHRLLDLVERETKPRDVVDRALAIVLEDAAATRGAVLWVERGSEMTPLAMRLPPGDPPNARVIVDRTALDFVLESGIAVAPAVVAGPGAAGASAYVPLCRSGPGRALGAVWLERAPGGPAFEERDLECAMLLANHMVRSVERVFTQRRREERVRARWRDRFSAIVDAIPEGIAVVRPDGTLDALNGSAREFFSRAHRKAPSGAATLVSTLSIADLVAEAFQGSRPARRDVVLADGEVIEVGAFPVSNPPVSVAVVLRDVTRERAREQYLRETERTRELGASLAGVAHELNNPLTSVMGFAELLASDVQPAQAEAALHIREQAARCLAIVQDILAFSSRRRREDRRLDLGEVAQNVRRLLQGDLEDSKTTLAVEGRAGPAHADPRLVQQVLVNLVRNAVQAIHEAQRPGAARQDVPVQRVVIRLGVRGARRTIEVEDSGPGIDAATQARLFKPFFTTRQKGTGLGLSISREIIQDYGGDLTVESAPGRTVFRLDLPAWDGAAAATGVRATNRLSGSKAAAAVAGAPPSVESATVVIADDDPAIRRLLTQSLVKLGHSVRAHVSGEAAWEDLTGPGTIDAAFLDLRMPPPDGLELRRRLQAANNPLADRIVIITGEVDEAILTQVTNEGARLLRKPFRLADAAALVEELRGDARRSSTHIKAATRERDLAGVRCLVVDDVRASRRLVAALFRPRGAEVAEAGDGPDAVKQVLGARGAGKKPFDLVLLDMNLPGLDGAGTARRLRELGITTPILAVTGSIRPQDRDALLGAGCDAILGKPFQNKELLDAVRRLLKRDGTAPTPASPTPAPPPPLERLRSLREAEGEFAPLLEAYRDDAHEHGAALARARTGGDVAGVRSIAHKVAGTGGSYGFPDLSTAARDVEMRLDRGEPLSALRADLDRLVKLLAGVAGR